MIVNYDGFELDERVGEAYEEMVAALRAKYYSTARRYPTSAFMRAKLGSSLQSRQASARVFETRADAAEFVRSRPQLVTVAA